MTKFNSKNERIKRQFFIWQVQANGRSESTVTNYRSALARFERYTSHKDLKTFNKEQAMSFKRHLLASKTGGTEEPISLSTSSTVLRCLRDFFAWLVTQNGYRKIRQTDIAYLNLTEKDERRARARTLRPVPTIDQINSVLRTMPSNTLLEKRNRAIVALVLLTGIRDGAIPTLKVKHVRLEERLVEQLASEVSTKFSKTIYTYFFPVGDYCLGIFVEYFTLLKQVLLFGDEDPVFPRTKLVVDSDGCYRVDGLDRAPWRSAAPIRRIFKEAFVVAGLRPTNPHSFRYTLVRLGERICRTPEQFKAWSQNLGHEHVSTTLQSYGAVDAHAQGELILKLWGTQSAVEKNSDRTDETLADIASWLQKQIEARTKDIDNHNEDHNGKAPDNSASV